MKWTKEIDSELIKLIHIGKRHDEIAEEFKTTKKTIQNRCFRLKIKTVYHKETQCKQCGNFFMSLISNERLFCSNSCANTFSSTGRIHSEESKEKTRKKLIGQKHSEERKEKTTGENNGMWIDGKSIERHLKAKDKINNKRKCRYCKEHKISKRHKIICDDCRVSYYEFYRPSCEFKFDINAYKNEFDFSIIEKYGWYSPSNKGNNLNGVSRDHLYSVRDGFINKIDFEIIKHPANCKLMIHNENNLKNYNSSITLYELMNRIDNWDKKYKL
jgi:hypothetical protein